MREDECAEAIRELKERVEALEGLLNLVLEELRDVRGLLERGPAEGARSGAGRGQPRRHPLLQLIEEKKYIEADEVRSKTALRKLMERGVVVGLRDEGANREVITTKEVIRDLLNKLPLAVDDVDKLDEREYELLELLNRLGYVIKKDNKYIATDLAREFTI